MVDDRAHPELTQPADQLPHVAHVEQRPALEGVGARPDAVARHVGEVPLDLGLVGGARLGRGLAGQRRHRGRAHQHRPLCPGGRKPVAAVDGGERANGRAPGGPERDRVVELPRRHLHLPGAAAVVAHAPARVLGLVQHEAEPPRGHEQGLRVIGAVRPGRRQVALEAARDSGGHVHLGVQLLQRVVAEVPDQVGSSATPPRRVGSPPKLSCSVQP